MRKSSKGSKASVKVEQPPATEGVDDVKVKAVNEMMERIKHGVVLRPVKSQESKTTAVKQQPPASEEKPQESAMEELKGILETVKRSPSRGSQESGPSPPGKKDSELEVILRRRRNKAGEAGSGDEKEGQMSHVSSSDSLNAKRCSKDSDSGRDAEAAGTRPGPERRGSGPGPVVARRRSSDTGGSWRERRSCSSLCEEAAPASALSNGCVHSAEDDEEPAETNGVERAGAAEEPPAHVCAGAEC